MVMVVKEIGNLSNTTGEELRVGIRYDLNSALLALMSSS